MYTHTGEESSLSVCLSFCQQGLTLEPNQAVLKLAEILLPHLLIYQVDSLYVSLFASDTVIKHCPKLTWGRKGFLLFWGFWGHWQSIRGNQGRYSRQEPGSRN